AIRGLGLEFVRARVGDRYVKQAMLENGWKLGGESSGHLICADVSTTGDGIVSALKVLEALQTSGRSLRESLQELRKFPQQMINVRVADKSVLDNPALAEAVASAEQQLAGRGRVLLRASGTEPVIRVMVEGEDERKVDTLARSLAEQVSQLSAA
ncbi:MAG TPA: phosphoglucosamine mutase, partial [Pseudomonadales bacterium]